MIVKQRLGVYIDLVQFIEGDFNLNSEGTYLKKQSFGVSVSDLILPHNIKYKENLRLMTDKLFVLCLDLLYSLVLQYFG